MSSEPVQSKIITVGSPTDTTLKVLQVTPQLIVVQYDLLPDTNPGANGHFAAIWQNTNNIPYNLPPEKSQKIEGSTQKGPFSFPVDLTRNNYIVGYAVGPEATAPSQKHANICSTVFIPLSQPQPQKENEVIKAEPYATFFTNLTLGIVTSDLVTFKYEVPTNCRPADNKAWIGLFRGDASYTTPPEKAIPVTSNEDSGFMSITAKIVMDRKYTLAYFMTGWSDAAKIQTRMAATLWFNG